MAYNPLTDFIALLRSTSGGVRVERMPGLDWAVEALARANLITLWVGQTPPAVNPSTTVWLIPAVPSWSAEGVVMLYNTTLGIFQTATPALWSQLIAAPFIALIPQPSNTSPLADGVAAAGVALTYSRSDHVHPTDTTRAPLASPNFTGTPTAPTPTIGDNSTNVATTAFVQFTAGVVPPIGTIIPYSGNTAPSANYKICDGSAISRTTFATLFGVTGITYGSGDGVTTFNIPDLRGRTIAGVDGGANRLTTASMTSQALGGTGGVETKTLVTANLPPYTPAGSISVLNGTNLFTNAGAPSLNGGTSTGSLVTVTANFSGSAQGGTSTAFNLVQPTMELQYLIRVS